MTAVTIYEGSIDSQWAHNLDRYFSLKTYIGEYGITDENDDGRTRFFVHATDSKKTEALFERMPEFFDLTYDEYCVFEAQS